MAGVSRFDCFPSDFLNGVLGLKADQIAIYTVLMMMQYDAGEPINFDARDREIAVRAGMSVGRARAAIDRLLELGKLRRSDDNRLSNKRAVEELEKIRARIAKNQSNSEKGGITTRKIWEEKRSKINDDEGRPASQLASRNMALIPPSPVPQPKKEDPSDLCPKPVRTRNEYPDDFEGFWRGYPTDSNMSKATALKAWQRLSETDRQDVLSSLPAFNRFCQSRLDYRPIHAVNYLTQRRWEGHLKTAQAVQSRVFVHQSSPQWRAWVQYRKSFGQGPPPVDQNGGWYLDSEWPPTEGEGNHRRASA